MKTKTKEKTTSVLIKELDAVFSTYIRLRDCDHQGTVTCFVTGEKIWWRDSDAAHFVPRAKMPGRYNQMNVHATSIESNRFDQNHVIQYTDAMINKYGTLGVIGLEHACRSLQKYTRNELNEMILDYRDKVAKIKREKGL